MARAILAKRARQDLITEKVYTIFALANLSSLLYKEKKEAIRKIKIWR